MRVLVLLGVIAAVGCEGSTGTLPPGPDAAVDAAQDVGSSEAAADTGGSADTGTLVRDAELADSGCPAPRRLTLADVPRGYLPAIPTMLLRNVDGDTAQFGVPVRGNITLRFLFVNTEESHGAETTAFGVATAEVVARYLAAARELVIVPRQNTPGSSEPDLDPYMRWLGLVFADGELLQVRLVREGLSAYYTEFGCAPEPVHTAMVHAEAEARANRRGIWAPGHPTNYQEVLRRWLGRSTCRPNPYTGPYCR
ncbi:MAG: thermonuclease family protein [Deltaproteobacteria bacterium]|nr:thermonuclease family protein [Deltaproteobacteria bacterium]